MDSRRPVGSFDSVLLREKLLTVCKERSSVNEQVFLSFAQNH